MPDDLFLTEKKGRKLYFTPVLNKGKRSAQIEQSLQHLDAIQSQWLSRAEAQRLISTENVLSGEIKVEGEIKTLSQLFALEHKKLTRGNL
ncbi:hypothetical protein LJQ72_10505 [Pectobacterium brasiliense]|uniref:hypothetical protein n=1 Tax=Pectobacterium brasiliense TaxID=180957 RepID=UPI001D0CFC98|nr:hypothetical protein [Pectobacterium brasiliense]UDQ77945.1 hypothetical protein LJQ72_10505 [Pectobacterium brasiliense]